MIDRDDMTDKDEIKAFGWKELYDGGYIHKNVNGIHSLDAALGKSRIEGWPYKEHQR